MRCFQLSKRYIIQANTSSNCSRRLESWVAQSSSLFSWRIWMRVEIRKRVPRSRSYVSSKVLLFTGLLPVSCSALMSSSVTSAVRLETSESAVLSSLDFLDVLLDSGCSWVGASSDFVALFEIRIPHTPSSSFGFIVFTRRTSLVAPTRIWSCTWSASLSSLQWSLQNFSFLKNHFNSSSAKGWILERLSISTSLASHLQG